MPKVPRLDSDAGTGAPETVPKVRRAMAKAEGRAKLPGIPGPQAAGGIVRATREDGIAAAIDPALMSAEGARILIYGRTRYGKSVFAQWLIAEMQRAAVCRTVLIHDTKYPDRPQYIGRCVSSVEALGKGIRAENWIVLRSPLTVADGALAARALAEHGEPACLVVDETRRALGGAQKWMDADGPEGPGRGPRNLEWICLEGGGVGASLVLLVQRPRQLPGDAVDSAQVAVVFGLGGRSLAYLVDAGTVPRDAADTIRRLAPGEFCLFGDDQDWNRTVYYSPL